MEAARSAGKSAESPVQIKSSNIQPSALTHSEITQQPVAIATDLWADDNDEKKLYDNDNSEE